MGQIQQSQSGTEYFEVISGRVERLMRISIIDKNLTSHLAGPRRSGSMKTGPWMVDYARRPVGLPAAVLFDNTLSHEVRLADPTILDLVTTELRLDFLRTFPAHDTELTAWTSPITCHPNGGVASGTLKDPQGTELIQATAWFHKVSGTNPDALTEFSHNLQLPMGAWTEQPLPQILGAQEAQATTQNASTSSTGFQPGLLFAYEPELKNPHGYVHGGALAMMAGLAGQHALKNRSDLRMQSLRVIYVRPGSGAIQSRVSVRHVGRALALVDVELFGSLGKPSVIAQVSFHSEASS